MAIPSKDDPRVFKHKLTVTLGDTNAEGTVSHDAFARFFGHVRELFGLHYIPGFAEAVAAKAYLLTTHITHYEFNISPKFGDQLTILVWVSSHSVASFVLSAAFLIENIENNEDQICATGYHEIVFSDPTTGKPQKLPTSFKELLNKLCIKEE